MKRIHLLIAALVATASVTLVFTTAGGQELKIDLKVGGHGTGLPEQTIPVPAAAVAAAAASDLDDHRYARDETPAVAPRSVIEAAREQQDALAATDQLPILTPDAAPLQRGCRTELVQNFSSRRGVRPRIFVLHYTVSPNLIGWVDVNGIVVLFDTIAFQASSNYVIDGEGHCAYIVRESDKAWTQATLNPVSISVEVINSGHEGVYLAPAGRKKLGIVGNDALCRWEIPVQEGLVVDGVVKKPGIVDHNMLGVAGGGHHDITPYAIADVVAAVKEARAKYGCGTKPAPAPVPKPKPQLPCTIVNLQRRLNANGARLRVDGLPGPRTRAATLRYQGAHRLNPTGRRDVGTCKRLGLKAAR